MRDEDKVVSPQKALWARSKHLEGYSYHDIAEALYTNRVTLWRALKAYDLIDETRLKINRVRNKEKLIYKETK